MKLKDFITTPDGAQVSIAEWARRIGVTRGYLCQLRDGNKMPSLEVAYRLELVTEGKVKMQDWVKDLPEFEEDSAVDGSNNQGLRGPTSETV